MACSCNKTRRVQSVYVPQTQVTKIVNPQQTAQKAAQTHQQSVQIQPQVQLPQAPQEKYDFGYSTAPNQQCVNCAMKHIAFAAVLWQTPQSTLEKYLACGQLLCAADHYIPIDTPRAFLCTSAASYLLYHKQNTDILPTLLYSALKYTQKAPSAKVYTPQVAQFLKDGITPQQRTLQQAILAFSNAYALLFAQMGYLELNKGYALGLLQRAALYIERLQQYQKLKDLQFKVRQLWKLVQQMTYMDDIYKQCRQRLQQILKTVIEVFEEQQV